MSEYFFYDRVPEDDFMSNIDLNEFPECYRIAEYDKQLQSQSGGGLFSPLKALSGLASKFKLKQGSLAKASKVGAVTPALTPAVTDNAATGGLLDTLGGLSGLATAASTLPSTSTLPSPVAAAANVPKAGMSFLNQLKETAQAQGTNYLQGLSPELAALVPKTTISKDNTLHGVSQSIMDLVPLFTSKAKGPVIPGVNININSNRRNTNRNNNLNTLESIAMLQAMQKMQQTQKQKSPVDNPRSIPFGCVELLPPPNADETQLKGFECQKQGFDGFDTATEECGKLPMGDYCRMYECDGYSISRGSCFRIPVLFQPLPSSDLLSGIDSDDELLDSDSDGIPDTVEAAVEAIPPEQLEEIVEQNVEQTTAEATAAADALVNTIEVAKNVPEDAPAEVVEQIAEQITELTQDAAQKAIEATEAKQEAEVVEQLIEEKGKV